MTTKMIEQMPTLFGNQFYPGGVPLSADKVSVNGRTVKEIFLDAADGDFGDDDPNVETLNNYYRYYMLAPCWDLGEFTEQEIMNANGERLFQICADLGIDPF
jgi:hypothetical protein